MKLQVEYVPIGTIKPYKRNAKLHPQEQIEQIKNSMREFGNIDPIGVWHDEIVEGHGRYEALKQMGVKEIPIIRLDDLTDEQRKAYALAHNKLTMNSDFDVALLDTELAEIETIDMTLIGFDDKESEPIQVQEDNTEIETPAEPKAKYGDIYKLGNHRLMCGDSTKAEDVQSLMDGNSAEMLFTSPPYSDMREYEGGKDLSTTNLAQFISVYKPYCEIECVNLGLQFKNKEVFPYWNAYIDLAHDCGMKLLAWNVWDKQHPGSIGMAKHMFPVRHEWIFVFGENDVETNKIWAKKDQSGKQVKPTKRRQKDGSVKYSTCGDTTGKFKHMESICSCYLEIGKIRHEHPATFPVKLPSEYIQALTDEGDNVIEPFGGSGTTLIACEQTNRNCFCMELEPKYIDVIINRWETFTGKKAELINGTDKHE